MVTLLTLPFLVAPAQKKDWAEFDRYAADNRRLIESGDTIRALFFGNSITDSWASMRPQFFSGNRFVGRGISGQSTYQFLARFREDAINLHPEIIVINGATNDIAENTHPYSEDRTFGNIVSMVELAQANGIKVILTSTLPAVGFKWNRHITDAPEKIISLNNRLREYSASKAIPFVEYFRTLVDTDGRSLRSDLSADGVHPNETGYEIMENMILPVIGNFH
ncbi:MAG: hypothetical protein K2J70_04805 [Muribaculaceae bacterium]|nr:hypothetical protein [Muribaculaceae bacterium]